MGVIRRAVSTERWQWNRGGGTPTGVSPVGKRDPPELQTFLRKRRFSSGDVCEVALPLRGTRPPYRLSQNPRTRSGIETSGLTSDERHTPAAQILIERRGAVEHAVHVRDAADVPRTDVLIERLGCEEHGDRKSVV